MPDSLPKLVGNAGSVGGGSCSLLILGLDPGLATTGYGVIDAAAGRSRLIACGALTTPAGVPPAHRLLTLHSNLTAVLAEFRPSVAAVEQLFFNRNVTSALAVAQGRGVTLLCCAQHELAVCEYTPLQVKLALTGNGRAEKAQVGYMVRVILDLAVEPRPDDAADAVAVALCHAAYGGSRMSALLRQEGTR